MEIALLARERGASVRYMNLRKQLPAVEDTTWLPRALDLSTLRIGRAERLLQARGVEVAQPALEPQSLAAARGKAREMLRRCSDTAAVCALAHEGFAEIGWGVLSSVVDTTRNPFASLRTHASLFERFLQSALVTYDLVRAAIRDFAPDTVVLFNGRYATTRAVFAAARVQGVPALIHDRGRDKDHYWLATEPILDPDYIQRCIVEFWRPDLAAAGEEFFRERRARREVLALLHQASDRRQDTRGHARLGALGRVLHELGRRICGGGRQVRKPGVSRPDRRCARRGKCGCRLPRPPPVRAHPPQRRHQERRTDRFLAQAADRGRNRGRRGGGFRLIRHARACGCGGLLWFDPRHRGNLLGQAVAPDRTLDLRPSWRDVQCHQHGADARVRGAASRLSAAWRAHVRRLLRAVRNPLPALPGGRPFHGSDPRDLSGPLAGAAARAAARSLRA